MDLTEMFKYILDDMNTLQEQVNEMIVILHKKDVISSEEAKGLLMMGNGAKHLKETKKRGKNNDTE